MKDLAGRVAVVTGGGSGIGAALARAFAANGMDVAVADVDVAGAEKVAADVRAVGRRAIAVATDVSKAASVEALALRTYDELGGCHVLCNNAGVMVVGGLENRSLKDWEWVIGVNLWGVIHGVQAFVPRMLAQPGEKHIVNTGSTAGIMPTAGVGIYATSKYAVVGLSEHLRMDLAPHGIGVSVLCPGGVQTGILRSERNRPSELGAHAPSPDDFKRMVGSEPRRPDEMRTPESIAEIVLEGIRANDAYILTHAHYRQGVQRRCDALMRGFDKADSRQAS